jgi:hypothetical protein
VDALKNDDFELYVTTSSPLVAPLAHTDLLHRAQPSSFFRKSAHCFAVAASFFGPQRCNVRSVHMFRLVVENVEVISLEVL